MTQDEIIRMAREAGFSVGLDDPIIYAAHERFAALVAAHAKSEQIQNAYQQGCEDMRKRMEKRMYSLESQLLLCQTAVADEREACAKVADGELMNTNMLTSYPPKSSAAWNIAAAIRARGEK